MTELQWRKRALMLESDLNRLALQAECERLGRLAGWADRLANVRSTIGPWARLLAPVAGAALALGLGRRSGWIGRLTRMAAWIGPLFQFWRNRVAPATESQP